MRSPSSRLPATRLARLLAFSTLLGAASSLALACGQASAVKEAPKTAEHAPRPAATGKYGEVPGVSVVPANGLDAFRLVGDGAARATLTAVAVEGEPFARALHAEVQGTSGNPWDIQLQTRIAESVQSGDVLLCSFYARSGAAPVAGAEPEAQTEFVFELARAPWQKSVTYPARVGPSWKQFFVRFSSASYYKPGEAQLSFRLGYGPQVIEIADVRVENFGKQLKLAQLPNTKLSYRGRELDAPWREAARARIDQHRRSDFALSVRDRAGKAIPSASLELKMTRQAFGFGSALVGQRLLGKGNERYQELASELFNMAVLENNLKWPPLAGDWAGGWSLDVAKGAVDWLGERGIQTRGHVLVWPSFRNSPRSLKQLEKKPAELRAAIKAHVSELGSAMKGKLAHWDVMNEPFDNHDFMDILGPEVMIEWFKEARRADPSAKLFINDYAILSGGGGDSAHRDHYERTIRYLIDGGAPVDGIGMQGHFGALLTSPDDLLKLLDRYAKFGKTIFVTEYDIEVDDEELAGDYTRDFYTTLFSHPAVGGILMWGFWDGAHFHQNAPLYRRDWSIKPAGEAYRKLVLSDFRSNAKGVTDAAGKYSLRAFRGSYELTVSAGGKTATQKFELDRDRELVVVLN